MSDAAKAIESPKTIWMSRRKPPLVSPKASVSPVTMMMITATIRATGPWMESRIDCSGASQGMLEPAAKAGAPESDATSSAAAHKSARRDAMTSDVLRSWSVSVAVRGGSL